MKKNLHIYINVYIYWKRIFVCNYPVISKNYRPIDSKICRIIVFPWFLTRFIQRRFFWKWTLHKNIIIELWTHLKFAICVFLLTLAGVLPYPLGSALVANLTTKILFDLLETTYLEGFLLRPIGRLFLASVSRPILFII